MQMSDLLSADMRLLLLIATAVEGWAEPAEKEWSPGITVEGFDVTVKIGHSNIQMDM